MIITLTLLFGALGIIAYKSKEDVSLIDDFHIEENKEEEDLYKDLEDLFI